MYVHTKLTQHTHITFYMLKNTQKSQFIYMYIHVYQISMYAHT
jgi:hypothetical protein